MEWDAPQRLDDRRQERSKRILVIRGTADILPLMRGPWRERYTITNNCVLDTFAQIAALDPAILVLDIAMGEQAGWQPFKRLLVEARKTGILMLVISTAPSLVERAQEQASQYGNLCYRAKPASFDGILAPIREMIEWASPSPS
jgi:DNA-binding NarL/FixJ family response regulator